MLATSGPWFDRRRPEKTWPSIVVSIVLTVCLFVSAFLAMQRVGLWTGKRAEAPEPPVVVRLAPPIVLPQERPITPPVRRTTTRQPAPLSRAPGAVSPPTSAPIVAAPAIPSLPSPPAVDTASTGTRPSPTVPNGIVPTDRPGGNVPYTTPPGVGASPSGVTIGSRTPNTQAYRDSVLTGKMKTFAEMAASHPPTGEELKALRLSQQAAAKVYQRVGTAGNANVHIMQGEGVGGEGAVGGSPLMMSGGKRSSSSAKDVAKNGGGSFGLPFLSPGPSAAERKRNEAIDNDNRARLRRLQDRIALKRDSVRRDSLRLDSLRRDSLARRRP